MNRDTVVLRLELIAAKAKQLAEDLKRGRLWGGETQSGLMEISKQTSEAMQEARDDR